MQESRDEGRENVAAFFLGKSIKQHFARASACLLQGKHFVRSVLGRASGVLLGAQAKLHVLGVSTPSTKYLPRQGVSRKSQHLLEVMMTEAETRCLSFAGPSWTERGNGKKE